MKNYSYPLKQYIPAIASIFLVLNYAMANAELLDIDFDDLTPYEMLPDEYPNNSGVHFSLRGSPPALPRPTTIPFADSTGPLAAFGAEGNLLTAGDHPPIPVYEVEISFDSPIDYFAVTALDNDEGFKVVGYLKGSVISSLTDGTYLGWYQSPDGWFRGPVHRAELGAIGGPLVFDQIVLSKVSGDMAERFENIQVNFIDAQKIDFNHISIDGGFLKLDTTRGYPPLNVNCSEPSHYGRLIVDETGNGTLWVCVENGWIGL